MKRLLFSIIVVAYNNENVIEQCLRSCVFADCDDYEVIVVYNKSDDRTLTLIEQAQGEHPDLFRIVKNDRNIGLGLARNKGMEEARGEYILFLDGDDWFSADVSPKLRAVIDKHPVDVCLFNHVRVYETFWEGANPNRYRLWEGYRNTPFYKTQVMPNLGSAWNKLYRRAFLREHKLQFLPGFYEDIAFNFFALMLAGSLYVIPDVLIYYRQRSGSITRSVDMRHFDSFIPYRILMDFFISNKHYLEDYGSAVYLYARGQLLYIVTDGDRLPRGSVNEFLRQADALLSEFRGLIGKDKLSLRERALKTHHAAFYVFVHRALQKYRRHKNRVVRFYKKRLAALFSREYWRRKLYAFGYRHLLCKRMPVVPERVIFESYWGRKMDCSPYALAMALHSHGGFECVWALDKDGLEAPAHPFKIVRRNSWEYWKTLASAGYFVSNVNFGDELVKRPGQVHLATQHGTPLKLMGGDIRRLQPYNMDWKKYAAKCKRWDFALSASPYASRIWRQSSPYSYTVIECGYPRNDLFFGDVEPTAASIRDRFGIEPSQKVALYAPTFRDKSGGRNPAGDSTVFDPEAVKRALGENSVLMLRGHHFMHAVRSESFGQGIVDVSSYGNFNELATAVDLLITDYSSVMFDFACLNRPIILYCYDYEEYAATRGMYFDLRKKAPGPVVESQTELLACLMDESYANEENRAKREGFFAEFCSFEDGGASAKVLETVFGQSVSVPTD